MKRTPPKRSLPQHDPSQLALFGVAPRMQMDESIRLTLESLAIYGDTHDHWVGHAGARGAEAAEQVAGEVSR